MWCNLFVTFFQKNYSKSYKNVILYMYKVIAPDKNSFRDMAELADAPHLGRGFERSESSSLSIPTIYNYYKNI